MKLTTLMCLTAAAWLLASCGEAPSTIKVGSAPNGDHSASITPATDNGLAPLDYWPRACQFITDRDIKAVMPQASGIRHTPYDGRFKLTSGPPDVVYTSAGTGCSMTWWLPGAERGAVVPTVNLHLEFIAVGLEGTVHANFPTSRSRPAMPDPAALGADECLQDVESYECRRNGVLLRLSWVGDPQVKGYEGQDKNLSTGKFWHDRVAVEFVKVVTGKLP